MQPKVMLNALGLEIIVAFLTAGISTEKSPVGKKRKLHGGFTNKKRRANCGKFLRKNRKAKHATKAKLILTKFCG